MESASALSSVVLRGWLGGDGSDLRVRITVVPPESAASAGRIVSSAADVHEAIDSWLLTIVSGD